MSYGWYETNVLAIVFFFVEVTWTKRKFTLVGFDDKISKISIPIGTALTAIDFTNDTIIFQLNENPLSHGGANDLILTAQGRQFGLFLHGVAKCHVYNQHTHDGNRVITMKFYKALMYVLIQESTKWDLDNFDRIMLTSYHTCYLEYTIDALKGSVILPNENEVEDNNYNHLHQTNNADIHLYNNYSDSEADEMVT